MVALTTRQAECLQNIKLYQAANGYPPSIRELMAQMGVTSPNGISCHLRALVKRGLLTRDGRKARGLKVATDTVSAGAGPDPERVREAFAPFSKSELRVYLDVLGDLYKRARV